MKKALAILGPTSGGKTGLAIKLCRIFGGEVVSADSRQVYRGMDIGTGKDLPDYTQGGDPVPYHLIDVADPSEVYDLARYQPAALAAMNDISARGKLPVVAGGTGLYMQALVDGFDLSAAQRNDSLRAKLEALSIEDLLVRLARADSDWAGSLNNSERHNHRHLVRYVEIAEQGEAVRPSRPDSAGFEYLVFGLSCPRPILQERIWQRLADRLAAGLVDEVSNLHTSGLSWLRLESFGMEYRYVARYLQGFMTYEVMQESLAVAIGQFAKRQMTWFHRWEKQGQVIHWISGEDEAVELTTNFLSNSPVGKK
jgi:tRNA dimethylallyltransferase